MPKVWTPPRAPTVAQLFKRCAHATHIVQLQAGKRYLAGRLTHDELCEWVIFEDLSIESTLLPAGRGPIVFVPVELVEVIHKRGEPKKKHSKKGNRFLRGLGVRK